MDTYLVVSAPTPRLRKRGPKPKTGLTPVEGEVLEALEAAIKRYVNPSMREIASCMQRPVFTQAIHIYIHRLAAKGYVELGEQRRARSIRLVSQETVA